MAYLKSSPKKYRPRYRPSARARANIRPYRPKGMSKFQYQYKLSDQRRRRAQFGLQARQIPSRFMPKAKRSSPVKFNGINFQNKSSRFTPSIGYAYRRAGIKLNRQRPSYRRYISDHPPAYDRRYK